MTILEIYVANSEHRGIVSLKVCQLGIFGVISSVRFKSMSCDEHAFDKYGVILSISGGGGGGGGLSFGLITSLASLAQYMNIRAAHGLLCIQNWTQCHDALLNLPNTIMYSQSVESLDRL